MPGSLRGINAASSACLRIIPKSLTTLSHAAKLKSTLQEIELQIALHKRHRRSAKPKTRIFQTRDVERVTRPIRDVAKAAESRGRARSLSCLIVHGFRPNVFV